ncbi:YiiD C-terminal domain-containing protein [Isoalcanivorax indicus]|uniref:YiiD C-terminal domain-containing protein n=1 Tax=Isoalcanivorax indicus TaxID=2202653 RepID=UPI000DBA14D6|nr:YiiD C-terminal domain-containing protein [Isoalcanivorax indicus]
MSDLTALAERVRGAIPLTRHLDFSFTRWHPGDLLLAAPLAPNVNDKGTFFAGSQAALLTLGGWALTTLEGEARVPQVDVVAAESSLQYVAPLASDATLHIQASEDDLSRFARRLVRRGRARLAISATLSSPSGEIAARFTAHYLARDLSRPDGRVD